MFHTTYFPRRVCGTCLPQLNHIANPSGHQISTSASRYKTKFDLSDDLTNGPHDLIGPPRPASNLRPVKFAVREGESPLEARLRTLRQETQKLNQDWWTQHNREFKQGRENFIKNILETKYPNEPDKSTLSADEMSQFYREFMNQQWKSHVEYNKEWQKRNWSIIFLSARVKLEKLLDRGR